MVVCITIYAVGVGAEGHGGKPEEEEGKLIECLNQPEVFQTSSSNRLPSRNAISRWGRVGIWAQNRRQKHDP